MTASGIRWSTHTHGQSRSPENSLVLSGTEVYSRDNRWNYFGLVNEPCFQKATGPNPERFGLWLDTRASGCAARPLRKREEVSGRGHRRARQEYPGRLILRLWRPALSGCGCSRIPPLMKRRKRPGIRCATTPTRATTTPRTSSGRTGSACPAGSAMSDPIPSGRRRTPKIPSGKIYRRTVGAQYFWVDRIFNWRADAENYIYQLMHTSRPGALDTSLITSDYINNPRTMNAVYESGARLKVAKELGKETLCRRQSRQQAVQRLRPKRTADRILREARTPCGRRMCSRTAPTRSECLARSIGSFSISDCSARNGRCISTPVVGGQVSVSDQRPRCPKELVLLAGD